LNALDNQTGKTFMSLISGSIALRTRSRKARPLVIALTASTAIHCALGAYLAFQRFNMPDGHSFEDVIVQGELFHPPRPKPSLPPPPKPNEPRTRDKPASSTRPDQHQAVSEIEEALDTAPLAEESPTRTDQGPVRLTTTPSEGPASTIQRSTVILKPEWVRKPTLDQVTRAYPDRAVRRGVSGEVMLSCQVTSRGTAQSCTVLTETPEDFGFGEAALKLSRYFLLRPMTRDGRTTENGVVTIPVRFNLG
jgi:protein TonB